MDWKAYNRFEQFAGEDVVLFEETINPPSQKITSSVNRDNYNNNNNNIAPPVPHIWNIQMRYHHHHFHRNDHH